MILQKEEGEFYGSKGRTREEKRGIAFEYL